VREGVRFATPAEAENLHVLKMSALDFVALGLASLIVALTMTREVRDLNIGAMMTMQAIERQRDAKKHDEDAEGGRARVAQTTTSQVAADGPTLVRSLDAEASDVGSMVQKGTNKILNELTMPSHLASFGDDDYKIGEDTYTHVWRYLLGGTVLIRRYIIIPEVASTVVLMVTRCECLSSVATIAEASRPERLHSLP
jgi:hypothetical protein